MCMCLLCALCGVWERTKKNAVFTVQSELHAQPGWTPSCPSSVRAPAATARPAATWACRPSIGGCTTRTRAACATTFATAPPPLL